jgi:hypothetical protein
MLNVSDGSTSAKQSSGKRLSQIVGGNIGTDLTQPCQPLGSGIRGSSGLVSIVASENEFCKNPTSKNTITTIDSEGYGSIGGHKHSLD